MIVVVVSLANRETAVSSSALLQPAPLETLSQHFDATRDRDVMSALSQFGQFLTGMHCFKSEFDRSAQHCIKLNTHTRAVSQTEGCILRRSHL